jgi:TM2 domain-containing membrane protein YozV
MSDKPAGSEKKVAAGILGILLGALGIHKFILGYTKEGVIMLVLTIISFGLLGFVTGIIGLVEGIIYLTKTDEEFVATYINAKKGWF